VFIFVYRLIFIDWFDFSDQCGHVHSNNVNFFFLVFNVNLTTTVEETMNGMDMFARRPTSLSETWATALVLMGADLAVTAFDLKESTLNKEEWRKYLTRQWPLGQASNSRRTEYCNNPVDDCTSHCRPSPLSLISDGLISK
jgi:hypothetical protein